MKKAEIKKGGLYTARVSGRFVTVRVDAIRARAGYGSIKDATVYDVTNLATGRRTTFRSAAKFRGVAAPEDEYALDEDGNEVEADPNPEVQAAIESGDFKLADKLMRTDDIGTLITEAFKEGEKSSDFISNTDDAECDKENQFEEGEENAVTSKTIQRTNNGGCVQVPSQDKEGRELLGMDGKDRSRGVRFVSHGRQDINSPQSVLDGSQGKTSARTPCSAQLRQPEVRQPGPSFSWNEQGQHSGLQQERSKECPEGGCMPLDEVVGEGCRRGEEVVYQDRSQENQCQGTGQAVQCIEKSDTTNNARGSQISGLAARIAQATAVAAVNLTPEQEDILATSREIEAMRDNGQRVMVIGAGAGCLAGNTIINTNRAGKPMAMELSRVVAQFSGEGFEFTREYMMGGKLVKSTQRAKPWDLTIPTYVARAEGEVIKLGRLVNAWYSGEKETYTVTTNTGRSIRATAIHPFLMDDGGWKRLEELKVGDGLQINSGRSIGGRGKKVQYKYSDTKFHPHQTCKSTSRQRYGVPTHRLVVEASQNGLTLREYLWILRYDRERSIVLTFLSPEMMVHHKNENTKDNDLSNLEVISGQKEHSEHHEWVNNVLWQVGFEDIVSIELYGVEPTYDLEVEDEPHNFLANGFVVHNTGKTFTLKQLEQVLGGNGQYTAFNKSLVEDSRSKFKRAAVSTTHALAFREVGKRFAHRLGGQRVKSWQVASALGIEDYYLECGEPYPPGSDAYIKAAVAAGYSEANQPPDSFKPRATKRLKSSFLAGQVTEAIRKFCQSADREIAAKHFPYIDGIDAQGERTNNDKVRDYLLPFAKKAWADLSSETGTLPFNHDCYVKIWQLGEGPNRPVIAADYILLDEYQDTAPVFVDVLKQQTHAFLILVGDDNQRIYEWRGAINAGNEYPDAPRRLLSQSFRFGQAVADVANAVLAGLEEPTDLVMRGSPGIPSRVCEVVQPRCYLYRTNAGAIGKLMEAMDENKRGHLIGGTAEVIKFCRAALDLQRGQGTTHQELGCFQTWAEVQEYSKEAEGADLRLMVKLVDEFGAYRIIKALERMPSEEDADLVLCTAHKSKGREWPTVRLGQDFPTANKLSDADRRLVYVAATRAQEELDISQCPTFCGGWDKQGGGEDGEGAAKWVPGIEIKYTAPMPVPEELAAYRAARAAAKSRPEIAPESPAAAAAPIPYPARENAAAANPGQANGNPVQSGEFSWANMDGAWLVRGPANVPTGSRVTVRKKNGQTSTETLREVKRKIGDLWFYGIR